MRKRSGHRYSILIVIFLISSLMAGCIGGDDQDHSDIAVEHIGYLISGNFEDFYDLFDDAMIEEISLIELEEIKETARKISELDIGENELLIGGARVYWEDLSTYDQVQTAKELEIPILVIQGERDYQVTMEDFNIWKENLEGNVKFVSYPSLNHFFLFGEGPSIGSEYFSVGNVDEQLVKDIAGWIVDI